MIKVINFRHVEFENTCGIIKGTYLIEYVRVIWARDLDLGTNQHPYASH